jgi:DNA polymerase-1
LAGRFYILDGSSYVHRAFHAIKFLSNSKGMPTNALLGFTKMLLKIIREHGPDYLAVVLDAPGRTFRDDIYPEYKATRPPADEALSAQWPYVPKIVEAFNIVSLSVPGVEADDVIATLTRLAVAQGLSVTIVTGDKDMMQLVSENVRLLDTMKDKITTPPEVMERFGVEPDRVADVMALAGDSSDNVPGVKGIGELSAGKLIAEFGSLENLLPK